MNETNKVLTYLRLAAVAQQRAKWYQRDKFLVLVAREAARQDRWELAEACRNKIVAHNPGHLLVGFDSMMKALGSQDLKAYLRRLDREWPLEKAEIVLSHPQVRHTPAATQDEEQVVTQILQMSV